MPISGNIRKFVFDLSLSNDKVFDHLSDELIILTKKRLLEVLEMVLSPLDNSNLVIDKIEIDIGDFDPRDLNGFVRKFKTELENFVDINFNGESLESDERVEAAILFFIKKGYYPWWVDSSQSFNKLILNSSDSLYFSKSLITLILANEKNYFRLLNDFNSEAKRIVYQKLLFGNVVLFNATISFYERLLLNYELPKRDSNIFILNKIEFFLIKQSQDSNDSAIIFFKTLKYFSEFISIPFSKFFRFISEEVIESETDSNIKSFFNSQSVNLIQESKKNNLSIGDTDIDEYKGSLTLESLINYLDKGLFQLNFTRLGEFKKFFDSLLTKRDTTLLNYLNSVSFYQNKEKLARLSALL
ncbi:contractile injection system tape measure protein, partial [Flavobacteriaceae bacterium]|nr:contractile injection system tape measure protein [Flavobacteriaceae bacterium]